MGTTQFDIDDIGGTGGFTPRQPSAIQTTVSAESVGNGTVVVTSGTLSGNKGRSITLTAVPQQGYVFSRWEIGTSAVQLAEFATVATQPVTTVTEVCGTSLSPSSYQNVARTLFTDGTMLYIDAQGTTAAPNGFWGAGSGTYFYWDGGRLPTLQTCTYGGGGGGGSPTDSTGDISNTSNKGDVTVSPGSNKIMREL